MLGALVLDRLAPNATFKGWSDCSSNGPSDPSCMTGTGSPEKAGNNRAVRKNRQSILRAVKIYRQLQSVEINLWIYTRIFKSTTLISRHQPSLIQKCASCSKFELLWLVEITLILLRCLFNAQAFTIQFYSLWFIEINSLRFLFDTQS